MPAIFATSGLPVDEHYRRFGRTTEHNLTHFGSLSDLLANAGRRDQQLRDFEQEAGVTSMDRIREFAKAASSSDPTLLGTGVMAGLGGPIGGGLYAGVKDKSVLTGLLALLASAGAAAGGARLASKGVNGALGRFAPLVRRGLDGLRKGEKLVTPGAAGWNRALNWAEPLGGAAGAMAGTYGVSTLASKKSASDTSPTMSSVAYSITRFHKIASQQAEDNIKQAGIGGALLRGGGALMRGVGRAAPRVMKNVTPIAERGVSSFSMPLLKQTANISKAPGLLDYLGRAGGLARRNPGLTGALGGAGAVAGYEGAYGRPTVKREGARLGAEGTLNQMSDYMGNAGLMERLAFLLNPQGSANRMRDMGLEQIMRQLG